MSISISRLHSSRKTSPTLLKTKSKSKAMSILHSLSKHLIFVHIFALPLFTQSVLSLNLTNAYLHHKCLVRGGQYQPGSKFEKHLTKVTESISTTLEDAVSTSTGTAPNVITVLFQCRGDSYDSKCRSCYATAVAGLRRRCQRNKSAKIWYDQCYLSISQDALTLDSIKKIDYENTFSIQNPNYVSGDTNLFNNKTMDFLHKLKLKAIDAPGPIVEFYAAGEEKFGANKLYAMVLCSQSIIGCKVCLESAIKELSKCCSGKQGARVYIGMTCNLRYELYPFLRNRK